MIRPALESGRWVVADRFVDSSLAYQGAARGLGIEAGGGSTRRRSATACPTSPCCSSCRPEAAWAREANRDDRIEGEGPAFQERVAAGYREVAARFPERVAIVAGAGTEDEVHERVLARVDAT